MSSILHIDLRALKDLQRTAAVMLTDDEGATTGFTLVTHHTADAYGAIESTLDPFDGTTILLIQIFRHRDGQLSLEEAEDFLDLCVRWLTLF